MLIYRLEHWSSGLGPFEHKSSRMKHPDQKVLTYLNTDSLKLMPDITQIPHVKIIIKNNPKCIFGWATHDKFLAMIKDFEKVKSLGFDLKIYKASPLHRSQCGQVIFLRE